MPIYPSSSRQPVAVDIALGLVNSIGCQGAVLSQNAWDQVRSSATANSHCNLVAIDDFRTFSGAWPSQLDFSYACTSLANVVISAIITNMTSDGLLSQLWDEAVSESATVDCGRSFGASNNYCVQGYCFSGGVNTQSYYMLGLFMMFAVCCVVVSVFVCLIPVGDNTKRRHDYHPVALFMRGFLNSWDKIDRKHGGSFVPRNDQQERATGEDQTTNVDGLVPTAVAADDPPGTRSYPISTRTWSAAPPGSLPSPPEAAAGFPPQRQLSASTERILSVFADSFQANRANTSPRSCHAAAHR